MKTTEVNKKIIGKRCKCIFTGLLVTGIIEAVEENEHSVQGKYVSTRRTNGGMNFILMTGLSDVRRTFSAL